MLAEQRSNSEIIAAYRARTPASERLANEARNYFPTGITHDSRYLLPYGLYVERAAGAHKWDVDGNEYVDYFGGHGALLLGHNHPQVVAAISQALAKGTHFGASHPLELEWAKLIQRLMPSAERIRFTASGTEATHMALRLARAFTGRTKLVRFKGHFHGWHDHMTSGYSSHFDGSPTPGVLASIAREVVLLPANDVAALRDCLARDRDIAAVFIEPTGASFGRLPVDPAFLAALREETAKHGVVLVFDEVITGFRVAPGGAQQAFGIRPDLTTMAKIIAGGLPGGAVAGRRDILERLDFEVAKASGKEKIAHQGTFNANPVSAAAGIAALSLIGTGEPARKANEAAASLRAKLNEVLAVERLPWAVYGTFSAFHIFLNPKRRAVDPLKFDALACDMDELKNSPPTVLQKLRLAMMVNGVDLSGWPGGMMSAAHSAQDLEATVTAFRKAVRMLRQEGEV
ncbi:MAG: aspartate aminotransferase family protein [Alphaproteobacteria bacterium]|nr:aspartate aminotransferase family protein [Alphaproteobacteria bacterium]